MGKTWKDRPWRLGGNRHKWYIASHHGEHGKFTRLMRRRRRHEEALYLKDHGEVPRRSRFRYEYFD